MSGAESGRGDMMAMLMRMNYIRQRMAEVHAQRQRFSDELRALVTRLTGGEPAEDRDVHQGDQPSVLDDDIGQQTLFDVVPAPDGDATASGRTGRRRRKS